jgi:hypothetical protein
MDASYRWAVTITKSDTVNHVPGDPAPIADAVWIGGAGIVALVLENDAVVNFTTPSTGAYIPVRSKRINSTTTSVTATMTALFR